jgi:hypothetical protein
MILQGHGRKVKRREEGHVAPLVLAFEKGKSCLKQAAFSVGRIVPTEARPSELSGCIVGAGDGGVKAKSAAK